MIYITESENRKVPGTSSLFVSFNYNEDVINSLKTLEVYNYDKKNHTWEIPVTELAALLDELTYLDDITITLLQDENKVSNNQITQQFKTKPFPYQLDGIKYGINHDKWLLLDAPGLGKTLQIIYIAEELKARGLIEHCLVICGVNTLKTNWKEEIHKHSKLDCIILGEHISKKGNTSYASVANRAEQLLNPIKEFFIITNIETLRSNDVIAALDNSKNNIGMLVVDEIHRCLSYNTLIDTNKGKIKIGDIVKNKLNVLIKSYNNKNNKVEYKKIDNYYEVENKKELLELSIEDEKQHIHKIICTPDHKLFTFNRGYIEAKNITSEDKLYIN